MRGRWTFWTVQNKCLFWTENSLDLWSKSVLDNQLLFYSTPLTPQRSQDPLEVVPRWTLRSGRTPFFPQLFFGGGSLWPSAFFQKKNYFTNIVFHTPPGFWPFWASCFAPWVPPGHHFGTFLGTKMRLFGSKKKAWTSDQCFRVF